MIKEQGVIETITGRKAMVRVRQTSACEHCKSRGSCHISERDMIVEIDNVLQAKVGDHVELSMPEGAVVKLSLLVYLFPIIALMIGAFIGGALGEALLINASLTAVMGGGCAMVIVYFLLKKIERDRRFRARYQARMIRVLSSAGTPLPGDNR